MDPSSGGNPQASSKGVGLHGIFHLRNSRKPSQAPSRNDLVEMDEKEKNDSSRNSMTSDTQTILSFPTGDPEDPQNWSKAKKMLVIVAGITTVVNSTLGSSLPSGAIQFIAESFNISNEQELVLPISIFLVGYIVGPLAFGPLSETYGRKIVMVVPFAVFTAFTLGCALAPNWSAFLVFRFICGVAASSPIAVVGGLFADVYKDPVTRGRAMAAFMTATVMGPVFGPTISGFVSPVSWRWTFWVGLIIIGVCWIPLAFLPESYGPTILKRRAQRLRKETGNQDIFAPIELEKKGVKQMMTVTLTRPLRMFFMEWIVLFTCLYLSLVYAIFYLYFEAYPLIFQGIYKFNAGESGLAFLPIGIGAALACGIFLWWDRILERAKAANKPWSNIEEYRRLPLACIAGPAIVISLFWIGWTSRKAVHWIVPMLSGIPFGLGFLLIFMALLNYLADAYEVYSASALAATSFCRSIFGAALPFAAKRMYATLGISWASSLLAYVSVAMTIIPFVFIKHGDKIRANSKFCQYLKQQKMEAAQQDASNNSRTRNPANTTEQV